MIFPSQNSIKRTNTSMFEDSDLFSIMSDLKAAGIFEDSMLNNRQDLHEEILQKVKSKLNEL